MQVNLSQFWIFGLIFLNILRKLMDEIECLIREFDTLFLIIEMEKDVL